MKHGLVLLIGLGACSSDAVCITQETSLSPDAASPAGIRPSDAAGSFEGTYTGTLSGPNVPATGLEMALTWTGRAEWRERDENRDPAAGGRLASNTSEAVCPDALVLPFDLRFETESGAFLLDAPVELETDGEGVASLLYLADARELGGDWERPEATYRSAEIVLDATLVDQGLSGSLVMRGILRGDEAPETWTLAVFSAP